MFRVIAERYRQGYRTGKFPVQEPNLPARFRGVPVIEPGGCPTGCRECVGQCPFGACQVKDGQVSIDLGLCLFCADCPACTQGRIAFSTDYRLATRQREELVWHGQGLQLAPPLGPDLRTLFGRSLKLRQVSAGGCNACEADCNVLGTLVFDLGRFGIQFVASPRHADGILVTGALTENMRSALLDTYEAVPTPKIVIAVGACAIGGGPFRGSPEVGRGLDTLLPVDLFIPGCPPQPYTILDGLLRLLGKREAG